MGYYGNSWLLAARERVRFSPEEPSRIRRLSLAEFDRLAEAVEKAIKAALIENHGSLPPKHDHQKLVAICQNTGVWDVLPPALRQLIQEVESYRTATTAGAEAVRPPSLPQSPEGYFDVARRLIDYIEYHVIGNDSVLRRLRVA